MQLCGAGYPPFCDIVRQARGMMMKEGVGGSYTGCGVIHGGVEGGVVGEADGAQRRLAFHPRLHHPRRRRKRRLRNLHTEPFADRRKLRHLCTHPQSSL